MRVYVPTSCFEDVGLRVFALPFSAPIFRYFLHRYFGISKVVEGRVEFRLKLVHSHSASVSHGQALLTLGCLPPASGRSQQLDQAEASERH